MFLGPLEQSKPWNTAGITGVSGFLKKLWKLYHSGENDSFYVSDSPPSEGLGEDYSIVTFICFTLFLSTVSIVNRQFSNAIF